MRDLSAGSQGHNLVLRVVKVAPAIERTRFDGSSSRLAEAVLADETGCVTLSARNGDKPDCYHDERTGKVLTVVLVVWLWFWLMNRAN